MTETTTAVASDSPPKPKSVSDLLKSAATKRAGPAKRPSGFLYDGDPLAPADVLHKMRVAEEAESESKLGKSCLRAIIDPWYAEQIRTQSYQATVRIICGVREDGSTDELRISYQHRWSKVPMDRDPAIRSIVGDDRFDQFFQKQCGFKIRKEISEDPERLTRVVAQMMEGTIAENFASYFEYEEFLYPTRMCTEQRWRELTAEQNAGLESQGLRQVVSFSDGSKE